MSVAGRVRNAVRALTGAAPRPQPKKAVEDRRGQPAALDRTLAVYHWTPKSGTNFGDEMGPMIAARILHRAGYPDLEVVPAQAGRKKLLTVGSVMQHARNGDVVWGSGINGKSWPVALPANQDISVRAVRGPLTAAALRRSGIACPAIYGDPGLLFPKLFAEEIAAEVPDVPAPVLYIPNLNDERHLPAQMQALDPAITRVSPTDSPARVARLISQAELVISSSLHGIVLADAYGVPCRPVLSLFEPLYKYADYFAGTGRPDAHMYRDIAEALRSPNLPPAQFDGAAIERAFPFDLLPAAWKTA